MIPDRGSREPENRRHPPRLRGRRGLRRPALAARAELQANDSEFLLQEHNADPEREPPGECSRTP